MWGLAIAAAVADDAPDLYRDDAATLLRWAQVRYGDGDVASATRALLEVKRRADAGESIPAELLDEALVQLAEIQFGAGDVEGATRSLEWLLTRHPDATVNPYHHDSKIVLLLDAARDGLRSREAPPPKRRVYPWWGYAPFGVPQFKQGRVAEGVVFGVAQGVLVTASVASYYEITRFQGGWWSPRALSKNADVADSYAQDRILYGVNLPSSLLFYGVWIGSVVAGHRVWAAPPAVSVSVSITPDRVGFGVSAPLGGPRR